MSGRPSKRPRRSTPRRAAGPARGARSSKASKASTSSRSSSKRTAPPSRGSRPKGLDGTQVEGRHAVRELLLAGRRKTYEVLLARDLDPSAIVDDIVSLCQELGVPVREVPRRAIDEISRTDGSQGVVARAAELPATPLEDLCAPSVVPPFLLALDGVTDPGNLGAVIRTAECAGVTGVILPRHRAAHVTPTVTKAAAGAVEHVPMCLVGGLPTAVGDLSRAGVWVVGLDATAEMSVHELNLADGPVCLVLGSEGRGLSRLVSQRCDLRVSIPLRGALSSLNVAAAAAIACYEVVRHRPVP